MIITDNNIIILIIEQNENEEFSINKDNNIVHANNFLIKKKY